MPMTKQDAMHAYRVFSAVYGEGVTREFLPESLRPQFDQMNEVLTDADRREALGLPPVN